MKKYIKKSFAIFSFYDPEGIVDDYVCYYLYSLRAVADRLIVAVNGLLTKEGEKKLRTVADEIYCRPNNGFDFGAYRDVLENYLSLGELEQYQELILCNDTCYGPFVPFAEIFSRMEKRDAEFWSINYIEDPLLPHFQSYFMVARGRGIRLVEEFLLHEVDRDTKNPIQACGYEHGLSETVLSSGIRTDYYTSCVEGYHNLGIFEAPDYAIELLKLPLLKRRAFSEELSVKDNCRRALCMIAEQRVYPVSYILDNVSRIYHMDFSETLRKRYITEINYFEKNYASRKEVIAFCKKYKRVYLYGNGYMATLFMARFKRYMNEFGGYVVSDEYYEENLDKKERIYRLSQIEIEAPLIVAMTGKMAIQIVDRIQDRENVLFLSIDTKTIKKSRGSKMKKAIIYGTGSYYEQNKGKLPKDMEIVAYADSNSNNATSHNGNLFRGLPVLIPEEFKTVVYDVIYICTDYAAGNRIFQNLLSAGIGSDRIFFLNRMVGSVEWEYTATDDCKGYLSTIEGITVRERYLTDFNIINEVIVNNVYGFEISDSECVVIDIGMNVAIASLYFASKSNVKRVYGFEAFSDTYEQAIANIALNPQDIQSKIVAENLALSDENGKKTVTVSVEETGWRNIFSNDPNKRQIEIECRDAGEIVKDILERHNEKIVLKIDTEGAEFSIFAAMDREGCFEKIDVIMMEYHGDMDRGDVGELVTVLKKYGYKIFVLGKRKISGMLYAVK